MSAFVNNLTPFLGTGAPNADGLSLVSFLEQYNASQYEAPFVTADVLVFSHPEPLTQIDNGLRLLLIRRANHPSIGFWALPGGFVNLREDVDAAAARELMEETGVTNVALEQLRTWGRYDRDPRWRIVTVSYLALLPEETCPAIQAGDDAAAAAWFDVSFSKSGAPFLENGCQKTRYTLILSNAALAIRLSAEVLVTENAKGLLKATDYSVISADRLAFDHPCFITQALLYLKQLLG